MIRAVAYDKILTLKIVANSSTEFADDLAAIKEDVEAEDRTYDEVQRKFVIKNPEKYRHLNYVQKALEDRERQGTLF